MKQIRKQFCWLLVLCLLIGLLPGIVMAAETQTAVAVEQISDGQYLYYGENKWQVLDSDYDNTGAEGIFLLSADVVKAGVPFNSNGLDNKWQNSYGKAWAAEYAAEAFSAEELGAIKAVTKTDVAGAWYEIEWIEGGLNEEQVFFLSAEEVSTYFGANGSAGMAAGNGWWLRSGSADGLYAGLVSNIGYVGDPHIAANRDIRPAMNLDTAKIVLLKQAEDGYKVSLLDESVAFTATAQVDNKERDYSNWVIPVSYEGAMTGENTAVSVMICDADGNSVYYSQVDSGKQSGTVDVEIPEGLLGSHTLKVFTEKTSEGTATEFASAPVEFSFWVDDGMADIDSWNLALGDDLNLKFYVEVKENIVADGYMNITVGNGETKAYKISQTPKDADGNYIFSANVAAAQMTDVVKLQLTAGEKKGAVYTYSVRQYADVILAGNYSDELKALVKEMLNYGGKAQRYFNHNTDNLADKGITVETVTVPTESNNKVNISGSVDGIRFYGASLVFANKTAVRYYFAVSGNIDSYSFNVGENDYEAVEKDGMYYVEIPGINPQDLANEIVLAVSDGTDSMTVGYSPLHYIVRMYAKGTDTLKNLLQAMYGYHLEAVAYIQSATVTEGVKLWWAYNTENFMQDQVYDYNRDNTLRMNGIKGDVESVQLMVTPEENVSDYNFAMGDIVTHSGSLISADCFEIYAEHYIEITSSYNSNTDYGYYPDALVPLENYRAGGCNSIDAGENQGIWLNLNIPADAEAGTYTGAGKLTLDGEEYTIPVELTVYDVTMPEQVHAVTAFGIWLDRIEAGEGDDSTEMEDAYYWYLVNKRIMPTESPVYGRLSWEGIAKHIADELAENPQVSAYMLPFKDVRRDDGVWTLNEGWMLNLFNALIDENIARREAGNETIDLFKKAYFYVASITDEPGADDYENLRDVDLTLTRCKFAVAERLNDYPDLKESLLSMENVITTEYNEQLLGSDTVGGVQTWCPQFQHFNTQEQRDIYKSRQNSTDRLMGENVWWYGCNNPKYPYPTYHLDDSLSSSRTLSWMQYDYGVEGNLYWSVNNYVRKGENVSIWDTVTSYGGAVQEGQLLYPGNAYGIYGPIATLRLESIREGNEDYEYFWLFEQKIQEYNEANGTQLDAHALLQTYFEGLYEGTIPTRDSDAFYQQRIRLLKDLEALYTDTDAAVAALTE